MILAAPLVIPFAKAVGISVATLGMAKAADMVNDYIQANPEESMKILSTIVPSIGIGQVFMNKEKISLEDLDEMTDEEAQDLSKEEKAELMKQAGKSGGPNKRQTMIDISEKLGLSGEGKEKQDIEYDIDERYDEGGVEEGSKPKFDYKKFFKNRRADGGRVGFNLGGLTGPAKSIYDSMMAAGYFTEDEIRNAIIGAGYEIPGASTSTPTQPEQVTGIINQQLQTGGDGPKGDFGIFGNLDKSTAKDFNVQVYDEEVGDFVPTTITGYKNVNSGLYQDKFGKNLQPAFSNKGKAFGLFGLAAQALGLTPDTVGGYVPGSIKGKYDGIGDMFSNIKNPFNIFQKQQATLADIQAMNKKAVDDLNAKLAAEKAAKEAARAAEMARYNITSGSDFGGGTPGGGGGNVTTKGGDVYGGAAYGYNEAAEKTDYYKDGGLASMFAEKR